MVTISFKADIDDLRRLLDDIHRRQLPYATSRALNATARDVFDAARAEMERAFDRPTRWTMNAFYVRRSTKTDLTASVRLKDKQVGRHYLPIEASGGLRPQTGLEKLLESRLAYSGIIQSVIPTKWARKDRYGNWSKGERNQVLSAIKAQRDSTANTTSRSRSLARNRRRAMYFVPRDGSKLSPGVWKRTSNSKRAKLKKILSFTDRRASYRPRFRFHEVAMDTARKQMPAHMARELENAIRTRR